MEAAVVGASTGVMKPLLAKLTKLLGEEYAKLKGVRKQIKFLRDELSAMSAALQILADVEELDLLMKDWRDKARELAYDIEDCVDVFTARVDLESQGGSNRFIRMWEKLKQRRKLFLQIQELKARAIEISDRHKRYNFVQAANNSSTSATGPRTGSLLAIDPRLSALYEEVGKLVGIDGPKKHIIEWLAMDTKGSFDKLKVVSIVGCGGLGKTTLANQVYVTIRSQFSCAAFVSVSRNPDIRKILRGIAKGVGINNNILDDDEHQLIDKLREYLQDKRYIVVVDDVWHVKSWETIKLALLSNNCGSRIIATTRNVTVASCCASQGGYVYHMKPLTFNDSKRLFFKRAFGSENSDYPVLEDTPDEILGKCGGLPLAIITVSSLLVDQHAKTEWDRVLNAIGSGFARDPNAESMTTILSLSFFDLHHHLRTCLLYLSVFPEDSEIKKHRLINRWIAEGFIHEEKGQSAYEIGEQYFNDLISRCLIQPADVEYGQAMACRVHDIILDYIKCKAAEENFVTILDSAEQGHISGYKVRRLCVNNLYEENDAMLTSLILSHVRTLTLVRHPMQTSLLPFTALRVLDLEDCWYLKDHHLASIEKLIHLKYLCLSSISITVLPGEIGELQCLETLDIQRTRIEELPSTIRKLQRLAHLYVHNRTKFPDGVIGQMRSLEELREYGVKSYEQRKTLLEISDLTKLRTLKLLWNFRCAYDSEGRGQAEDLRSYVGALMSSCNLHNLYIMDASDELYPLSLDSWQPASPCILKKLHMKPCVTKVPTWMGLLGNLRVLELYIIFMMPGDVEILGAIPSLLYLRLATSGGTNGRINIHGNSGFRSLKYFFLVIGLCGTALEFEPGSMPKLEHLRLAFSAHKMECLNGAANLGIQHLSVLNKVEVEIKGNCSRDSNYNPEAEVDDAIVSRVASTIKAAVETLPNRPTIRFETKYDGDCEHFKSRLKEINQMSGLLLTEWLEIWQIEEEYTDQAATAIAGDTSRKLKKLPNLRDETYEEEKPEEWKLEDGTITPATPI